jgi:ADP-ribose pyrophosphatase YjhB (NUDIX family)
MAERYAAGIRIRVAVLLVRDGAVLLVRHRKPGREYWLVPGGGVDPGETLEEAGRREVLEETGLEVEMGRPVLICEAIDPEGSRHVLNVYFQGSVSGGTLKLGEEPVLTGVDWFPAASLRTLETYPPIGGELAAILEAGFPPGVRFLGNVWGAPANGRGDQQPGPAARRT